MNISQLHISGLRNIASCSLNLGPQFNVIVGPNGSGKSSILEAIYLLGRAKSFRSAHNSRIVRHGQTVLTVFGKISDQLSRQEHSIGVQVREGKFSSKVDGQFLRKSSRLATLVPLLLINPDADKLVKGGPRQRRRFLDWGLFHVEHKFLGTWQRYNRALLQRNAQLRSGKDSISLWDRQLIVAAEELHFQRLSYVQELGRVAQGMFEELVGLDDVGFSYQFGWPKGLTIQRAIEDHVDSDVRAGFTQRGPHRADLVISVEGNKASEVLSGGQQKLVACALIVAQAKMFAKKQGESCLLLIDDLPAELDVTRRKTLMDLLGDTGCQLFVTTTDIRLLDLSDYDDVRMFHVEHGVV